jgi:hypothetical protein
MLGKYVEKLLVADFKSEKDTQKDLTLDFLRENGFV